MRGQGLRGLLYFLGFILSPAGILGHTLMSERDPQKFMGIF